MKTILSTIFLLTMTLIQSQNVAIPDANFKTYLVGNTNINTNGDAEISVAEAQAFTGYINVNTKSISDLTGIEAFINLTNLNCNFNKLTALNLSANTKLTDLDCGYNKLTVLDLTSNSKLKKLYFNSNNISNLNLENLTDLEYLESARNKLLTLNLSKNTKLKGVKTGYNQLTALDTSKNLMLTNIGCESNLIVNIDISANVNLTSIDCRFNKLRSLNLNNGNTLYFNLMKANGNPELSCIQVDNMANVRPQTWSYDSTASFSVNCNYNLGVINADFNAGIKIYPNPASHVVTITSSKSIESLKIYSIAGALIKTIQKPGQVDVSTWSKGMYLFVIQTGNQIVSKEVLVK